MYRMKVVQTFDAGIKILSIYSLDALKYHVRNFDVACFILFLVAVRVYGLDSAGNVSSNIGF